LTEALKLIEHALSIDPENAAYLDTKAEILFKLGFLEGAVHIEKELMEGTGMV